MHHRLSLTATLCLSWTCLAQAEYAQPPYERPQDPYEPRPVALDHPPAAQAFEQPPSTSSTVRVHAGPALRLRRDGADVGAQAAMDIGEHAVGLRIAGAWVEAGAIDGLSQYTTEFWLDLGPGRQLYPVVGAGAGVARVGTQAPETTQFETVTLGLGVLRAGLEVALPVRAADARASLQAVGCLPVAGEGNLRRSSPWGLLVATVGVGL